MAMPATLTYTPDEYLALERISTQKSEYLDGLEATVAFVSIGCEVRLEDVYGKVRWGRTNDEFALDIARTHSINADTE